MEKISNLTQALNSVEEIRAKNLDLSSIQMLLREQSLAVQVLIYSELEEKDLALQALNSLAEGKDFEDQIIPFLSASTVSYFVQNSLDNYLQFRSSSVSLLQEAAVSIIAPSLATQLNSQEKADVLSKLVGEEAEVFFMNKELIASSLMKEIISELAMDIKVLDTKTEMAIEYAEDPIQVILHSTTSLLEWRLQPQVVQAEESYWESIKNTLINFSKNTIMNPSFRKYAIAGIALGVAIAAPDSLAGVDLASDIDFDKAKELFGALDEQLNNNFMPKHGFKGCNVSVDFAIDSAKQLKTHINLGDKQMVFDLATSVKGSAANNISTDQFQVYIENVPKPKSGGCNMSKQDLFALAKAIKNQLVSYAGK